MKNKMTRIENTGFWIFLAFVIKLMVILFLTYNLELWNGDGLIGVCNGDCPDYLHTAEMVAQTGTFGKMYDGKVLPYAGRMPGYDVILAPLSMSFEEITVKNIVYVLQILLSALSTYYLAKTIYWVFPSERLFYFVFFVYGINSFVTLYDLFILTESFFVSAFIISFYLFISAKTNWHYFLAGLFLTWAILMRPYILPLWVIFNIYLVYIFFVKKTAALRMVIRVVLSFNLVFILTETIWITRNYLQFNKFIPIVTDVYAGLKEGKLLALMEFVQAWGGDIIWWNPDSEIALFYKIPQIAHLPTQYKSLNDLPDYVFTSVYNADSLANLKKLYEKSNDTQLSSEEREILDKTITKSLRKYRKAFISEKPFYFYVVAPLRLLPKFLFHSGSYNISNKPFIQQNWFQKVVKLFYSSLYYFTLLGGFFFIFYAIFNYYKLPLSYLLLLIIPLYIIALCPLVLRRIEYRYFILAYPYFTILACYMLNLIVSYFYKTKIQHS
ncbi:MAG: hypothetical protein MUE81_11210 [Thermoflexibacter sp.]|nr:hypothetical protein [Thermoflexibacter sp.]